MAFKNAAVFTRGCSMIQRMSDDYWVSATSPDGKAARNLLTSRASDPGQKFEIIGTEAAIDRTSSSMAPAQRITGRTAAREATPKRLLYPPRV